jgi:hypothetical protein
MTSKTFFALALILTAGCKAPQMQVHEDLKNNGQILPVKGRQGFQIGRELSFGEFTTDKVRQGWAKGYDIPFILRFQGVKEKLSFSQFGKPGQVAEVYCIGKFRSIEMNGLKDYFTLSLKEKNHFAGTVILNGGRDTWEFLLYNPDGEFLRDARAGFIRKNGEVIDVNGVRKLENTKHNFGGTFLGYEFVQHGQVIGAVEIVNNGRVWLKNDLPDNLKLVLASLSSGALLRTNLQELVE